jgi:threonine aldolase
MRQAGIVAAAALWALDHHVARLADDHARARRLAEGLAAAGVPVDGDAVETNFVAIDIGALGLAVDKAHKRTAAEGVLVGDLAGRRVGAATYLGISDDDIEQAIARIARALVGTPMSVAERSST